MGRGAVEGMTLTRRRFLSLAAPATAAGILIPGACSRAPENGGTWDARIAALETRIRQAMTTRLVPGVQVALIRDARVAWQGHFGVRDQSTGAAVDDETVFSAQSMSKPAFAYRVMKL